MEQYDPCQLSDLPSSAQPSIIEAPLAPQPAIRLGLRQVKGLSQETADRIAAA